MPNHISNRLKVIGTPEQVQEVMTYIQGDNPEEGTIDFNTITPMPKWVYGSNPDVLGISIEDTVYWGRENTCLEWAKKHWGTKWNAYDMPDRRNTSDTIHFSTAWSGVKDLIWKLGWIFPDVELDYKYADEDYGSRNNGEFRFKGREIIATLSYDALTKQAYELSFELSNNGKVPDHYMFDEEKDTYVCKEDEEFEGEEDE